MKYDVLPVKDAVALPASITGGANIHIFVFTDLKNNRFQKKLMMQNIIHEYSPLQLSMLATPLQGCQNERQIRPRQKTYFGHLRCHCYYLV